MPRKKQERRILKLKDFPESALTKIGRSILPHSIALARVVNGDPNTFQPLGTGVLVQIGEKRGILTAHHCLHKCIPEVLLAISGPDTLLILGAGGRVTTTLFAYELKEHVIGIPRQTGDFGPDLTFIEIMGIKLGTLAAVGAFWPLTPKNKRAAEKITKQNPALNVVGYPELYASTSFEKKGIIRSVHHMSFIGGIEPRKITRRWNWDYVESECHYDTATLPHSFEGVSGGPIWAIEITENKTGALSVGKICLVEIAFYQTALAANKRTIRGHFIKSIYTRTKQLTVETSRSI